MGFDLRLGPCRTDTLVWLEDAEDLEAWLPWRRGLAGDIVVTLLARDLLPSVLEPLTSALAARSRFSLERFSDVYIVTRAVCAHVRAAAGSSDTDPSVAELVDELTFEHLDHCELLRVVLIDRERDLSGTSGQQ